MTEPGQAPETAYPVRELSTRIGETVKKWPRVWVEGQLAEVRVRGTWSYITLRDSDTDMSLSVSAPAATLERAEVERGSRVVALLQPEWRANNGSLQFRLHALQPVGVGELLLRLEKLRALLAAEGLFAPERKRSLPVLPRLIGLVCGRNSDAMHDVITNATKRWPHVQFEVAEVAVQGSSAVEQVTAAVRRFDADARIDVIVVTRGGGAFEDLLPFSDEGLLRAVAACVTPVVSAIGHEQDRPLLDEVADLRASTPTDAARRIVPDMEQELASLARSRRRMLQRVTRTIERETHVMSRMREAINRAHPAQVIREWRERVSESRALGRRSISLALERRSADLATVRALLAGLSPQATLNRGFAVVRDVHGVLITDPAQVSAAIINIRVAHGSFRATPIVEERHA